MVNAKKTGSRVRMMPESNVSSSQAEPKGCCGFDLDRGDYKGLTSIFPPAIFPPGGNMT